MRSGEDLAEYIAETLLPGFLDMAEWGIIRGVEIEEDSTKRAIMGVGYGGNSKTSSPDGQPAEVGNPFREYRFVLPIMVADLQHANQTQIYLGRKMTEAQEILEDQCGMPRFEICSVNDVTTGAQKSDNNTGQVDLMLIIADY